MTENPQNPQYGPQWVFHHWGEPYLGYYLADDDWVIRKHAQMLTDAGVDVIIVDLTNAVIYLPQLKNLCKVYTQIREAGGRTPQLSFIFNTQARETVQRLYDNFYAKGLYKDLWFYWKGKPLILCPPAGRQRRSSPTFHDPAFVVLLAAGVGVVRRRTRQMAVGRLLSAECGQQP